eukprot:SAG11_NODE_483_length_9069_cov_31.093534_3_plen_53_part_00
MVPVVWILIIFFVYLFIPGFVYLFIFIYFIFEKISHCTGRILHVIMCIIYML